MKPITQNSEKKLLTCLHESDTACWMSVNVFRYARVIAEDPRRFVGDGYLENAGDVKTLIVIIINTIINN